jgi:hypothetical protein
MRSLTAALLVLMAGAKAASGQQPTLEEELRAEVARLRESLARAEALLARLEKERAVATTTAPVEPKPAPTTPAPPPGTRRAPALNTPPKLPVSSPENYRKNPPRFDVLLQARYDFFENERLNSTFFLRKAELGVKGHIASNVDFSLELDPVRTAVNDPFRRTYVRLSHFGRLHFKIGLEKAPIGLDELTPTAQIPFVERSEVSDRFAAAEEMGVFAESTWDHFMLQASLTNGGRRLYRDDNRHKDVTARAVWAPHPNFSLGVATLQGKAGPDEIDRIRYNVEAKYGTNLQGAQGEFYRAKTLGVWSDAFYVAGFWALPVRKGWLTHIQPVGRYEHIDRDDNDPALELRLLTVGLSVLFSENRSKLQVNWLTDVRRDSPRKDEIRAQYQVEF